MIGGKQRAVEVIPFKDHVRALLAAFLLVTLTVGCGKPCDEFADLACGSSGAESPECVKARDYAENAPGAEQKICAHALKLANALKRK